MRTVGESERYAWGAREEGQKLLRGTRGVEGRGDQAGVDADAATNGVIGHSQGDGDASTSLQYSLQTAEERGGGERSMV